MSTTRFCPLADVAALLPADSWIAQRFAQDPDALSTEVVLWITGDVQVPELHLDAPLASGSPLRSLLQGVRTKPAATDPPFLILIEGHLQIDGALTCDDTDGATHLIVLGDAGVRNAVVGGQLLYVQGALQVADLLWGDYNHGDLTVRGGLTARVALFTDEYHVDITGPEQVEFLLDEVRGVPSLVEFSAEAAGLVFAPEFFGGIDDGEAGVAGLLDRDQVVAAVRAGESPVRSSDDIKADLPVASDLFADEAISVANILAAVNSPVMGRKEKVAYGWFGQTDFTLCRRHIDGEGDQRDDNIYITVWKTWDFYIGVTQEPAVQGTLPRLAARVLRRSVPTTPQLSLAYRPYEEGVPGEWVALDEDADAEAREACEKAWRGVLDYVRRAVGQSRAGYPLHWRLEAELTAQRIEHLTSLPVFTDVYNDWWDSDKDGTWYDDVWVGARQPCMHEGEPWGRALKLSYENGEDAPGDPEDDAHACYQIEIDEARAGPALVEFTYVQRQSEHRQPLPRGAADHIARLLRLYGRVEATLLQAREDEQALQTKKLVDQAEASRIEAAVHLLTTPPLAPDLPDAAVFPAELMLLSAQWQAGGQAYVAAIRNHHFAMEAAESEAQARDPGAAGDGANEDGPVDDDEDSDNLPEDPRKASAATVLQLARVVNRHADEDLSERFRQRFAFAPDAYVHLASDQGQFIGPVFWLPDGDGVVAHIGAEYSDDAHWVRLQGHMLTPLPALKGMGRSHDGRCFALSDGTRITTHQGLGGPQIAQWPLPQGNEGLPASLGLAGGRLGQRCDEVIPFNDGQRALLRNPTGVYLLTPEGVQRIHPQEFDEDGPYSWPKNQMQEGSERREDEDEEDEEEEDEDLDGEGHGDGSAEAKNTAPSQLALDMLHMALSPDEKYIALGDQDSAHVLLDAHGRLLRTMEPLSSYPHHARFTHDGTQLWANSCHFYNGCTVATRVGDAQDTEGTPINTEWRVYASATLPGMVILGDANGYLHARDDSGNALWRHHIGSTISAVDVSPDGSQLLVGSYGGYLVLLQEAETGMDPYSIGTSPYVEVGRWIFWSGEAGPLRW